MRNKQSLVLQFKLLVFTSLLILPLLVQAATHEVVISSNKFTPNDLTIEAVATDVSVESVNAADVSVEAGEEIQVVTQLKNNGTESSGIF